jgi:hypothetical protein
MSSDNIKFDVVEGEDGDLGISVPLIPASSAAP